MYFLKDNNKKEKYHKPMWISKDQATTNAKYSPYLLYSMS